MYYTQKLLLTGDLQNKSRRLLKGCQLRAWKSRAKFSSKGLSHTRPARTSSGQTICAFNGLVILGKMLFPKSSPNGSKSNRAHDARSPYTSRPSFGEINHHTVKHKPAFLGDITTIYKKNYISTVHIHITISSCIIRCYCGAHKSTKPILTRQVNILKV